MENKEKCNGYTYLPAEISGVVYNTTEDVLARVNELAKKAKTAPLSVEETAERDALRALYIKLYRQSLMGILDNTYVKYPDGRKEKLKKK